MRKHWYWHSNNKSKLPTYTLLLASIFVTFLAINLYSTFVLQIQRPDEAVSIPPPSQEYEVTRRRILTEIKDIWYYTNSQIRIFTNTTNDTYVVERSKRILEENDERHRSILRHLRHLSSMDKMWEWRMKEAKELEVIVQNRFHYIQNPPRCSTAKKLICELCQNAGFSAQISKLALCLGVAYNTQRTMTLSKATIRNWTEVFKPFSDSCVDYSSHSVAKWPGNEDASALIMTHPNSFPELKPDYIPLAIPEDLSDRLTRLYGNQGAWWIGQIYRYLLRPQESTEKILKEKATKINFDTPIVGVQVRRTDKLHQEASFHSLEDYMVYVEDHFRLLELEKPGVVRRVYLATDEPALYDEAKTKYPQYVFLGDPKMSSLASSESTRYSKESLQGFITDIHFLSHCDFLVCTFSSGVCRLAYALMQTYNPESFGNFQSLDDIFHFIDQSEHLQKAIAPHEPQDSSEIDLQVGDLIHISGNLWNGFSDGINKRSGKHGLYPSNKVEEVVNVAKMPVYPDKLR